MGNIVLGVLGIVVAAGSLTVAIIALRKSLATQTEATDVQRRLVQIEENREADRIHHRRKASLRLDLRHTEQGSYRLYVVNDGESQARNVSVLFEGSPIEDHCSGVQGSRLPADVGARSEVSCLLAFSHQCAPPFPVELSWDDDSGEPGSYKGSITF
jgi:hypothetical protein